MKILNFPSLISTIIAFFIDLFYIETFVIALYIFGAPYALIADLTGIDSHWIYIPFSILIIILLSWLYYKVRSVLLAILVSLLILAFINEVVSIALELYPLVAIILNLILTFFIDLRKNKASA